LRFDAGILALLALAAFAATGRAGDTGRMPRIGEAAPDFALHSQDGGTVSLKDFRGKWVVLYFYPYDENPGSTLEAHHFQSDLDQFEQAHAVVLGVSSDSPKRHQAFAAKQELTFKLLSDPHRKAAIRYGTLHRFAMIVKPADSDTFLIDPEGRIARIWLDVNSKHHSAEVLAAIAELQKK
jgi:peroxiredoxin Q/BCP